MRRRDFLQFAGATATASFASGCAVRKRTAAIGPPVPAEKTVIHDYGFGGAGMSLAWGCGAMAAGLALEHNERKAAVLGCGSPGLTAARQLQRRGFEVPRPCP